MTHTNLNSTSLHTVTRRILTAASFAATLAVTSLTVAMATPVEAATHTVCASGCDYSSVKTAVNAAASGDVLELAPETFLEGRIVINKDLTIRSSSGMATVDSGSKTFTFMVLAGKTVFFEDLRLQGGTQCRLNNMGDVELSTVWVLGNGTLSSNGGILNQSSGSMVITDASLVAGNASSTKGGGINNSGGDLLIENSTVMGNHGYRGGGLRNNAGGTTWVYSSSFSFNHATYKGGAWANISTSSQVFFSGSASTSGNTADVDCDTYQDVSLGAGVCVN